MNDGSKGSFSPTNGKHVLPQASGNTGDSRKESHILSSWKEIAAYLGRSVRTVQRMELELGLPVRRPKGHARSSVMAIPQELDEWLKSFAPQRTDAFRSMMGAPVASVVQNPKVLIVDDREANSYALSKHLRRFGYEVLVASCGREALKMALRADVMFLDVNLPDIHGFEVLRRLRSNLTTTHIPVICTSATYQPEGAAPLALQLGASCFLTHPISAEVLHSAIQQELSKMSPATGAQGSEAAAGVD